MRTGIAIPQVAGDICIAPMLFIPFIENAFKHCTDKKAKEAICFHFQIQSSEILFTASNLYDPLKRMNKDSSTGIGLSTVKRRLDFLYAGRYNLQIKRLYLSLHRVRETQT